MSNKIHVQAVANYFLDKAKQENREDITNLKIQKLVYIAYGIYAGLTGEELFANKIEAWPFGPVIPALYYEARRFGSNPVTEPFMTFQVINDESITTEFGDIQVTTAVPIIGNDDFVKQVLDYIWTRYAKYKGWALSRLTHLPDAPWDQVYNANNKKGSGKYQEIEFDRIKNYYKDFIQQVIDER